MADALIPPQRSLPVTDRSTTVPAQRGYVTLAARHPMYLEMAVDLALSLRDTNPEPLSLVVDAQLRRAAVRRYHSVFDELLTLPAEYDFGRALKYSVAELTPYQRTLFIDADTLALGSLAETWERLGTQEFAMMQETLEADDDTVHHGRTVRFWCERFGLKRYVKTASAVFYFEKAAGRRVLAECLAAYRDQAYGSIWAGDEIGFAIAAERIHIGAFPGPAPIFWTAGLKDMDISRPAAPLFTGLGRPPKAVMNTLLESVAARRARANLSGGSGAFWRLKAWSSNAGPLRGKMRGVFRSLLGIRWTLRGFRR